MRLDTVQASQLSVQVKQLEAEIAQKVEIEAAKRIADLEDPLERKYMIKFLSEAAFKEFGKEARRRFIDEDYKKYAVNLLVDGELKFFYLTLPPRICEKLLSNGAHL